ncbi:hypothetical protein [Dendronalium phyllosphericum]|uniref:nucleotide-binding protein n=1 Tax=Dendronalium phyllosphericum TaxID=2840445 RepID=UPI001CECDEB9|nr:hypothetical protein [Dendronalium phyllosphericum]
MTTFDTLQENNQNMSSSLAEISTSNTEPNKPLSNDLTEKDSNNTQSNNPTEKDSNDTQSNNPTKKDPINTKPKNRGATGNKGNNNKNSHPEQLRRLVMVTGDKGGVGKSTFARGLAQTYIDNAVRFVGLDADSSNPHLIRFYGKNSNIYPLDISNSDKLDDFLDNLKEIVYPQSKADGKIQVEQSLILLETPSQFLSTLKTLIEEMGFLGVVNDKCKMRVTIVIVISTIVDCINQLL